MDGSDSERLKDLEIKYAFQEHLLRELDEFVRALSSRLEKAERDLADLQQSGAGGGLVLGPQNDPPPHY